jgi:hypothetical protein
LNQILFSTKEALILLKLKQGSALLLKDMIYKALHDNNADNNETNSISNNENSKLSKYNAKNSLKEFGIVQLSCEQAEDILSRRTCLDNFM